MNTIMPAKDWRTGRGGGPRKSSERIWHNENQSVLEKVLAPPVNWR
jgi:hypothetical protein